MYFVKNSDVKFFDICFLEDLQNKDYPNYCNCSCLDV